MIDTQAIRTKILDLAMRGQLTEQLPEDGTAEELYQQMKEEKARLIKECKIKKEKSLSPISEDEIPFEIPRNWKWVRLSEICKKIVDGDHNPPAGVTEKTEYLMLSAQNIFNDRIVIGDNVRYLTKDKYYEENKRTKLEQGDVLLTIVATLGRSCVFRDKLNICFQRSVCVISTLINPDFLKRYFDCRYIQNLMTYNATGSAQPGFYLNKVERMSIPVPPISEQQRIVEKIQQIFSVLDAIDNLQSQYFNNQAVLKEKLIDAAIRGKLTEHLPEDGTAEELYQQIQAEKQNLIKLGKLKKEKELPEIKDDEKPFEIPKSWKWVRVGTITEVAGGTTPNSSDICEKGIIPYFKVSDMNIPGNETNMVYASNYISNNYSGKIFPAGTTIFPKNGGAALTNKRRILTVPSAVDLNTGGCTPIIPAMTGWIRLFMETVDFGKMDTGSNIPTVNATNLKMQGVSLPPLAEQKRIVVKLDELLRLIDGDKVNN